MDRKPVENQRVSCVIPTRNRKSLVQRAVQSVMHQSVQPMEIIVVDDGSTDGTAEFLQRCYPFIQVVSSEGLGPGQARNLGVAAAAGDVIMYLDSDDVWLADHVQLLQSVLHAGYEVGYGVTRTHDQIHGGTFFIPDGGLGPSGDCFHALLRWCFMVPSSVAVSRRLHWAVGGFGCNAIGEDWAYFLRLAAKTPFGFTTGLVTDRYLHAGSQCCLAGDGKEKIGQALDGVIEVLGETPGDWTREIERMIALKEMAAKEGDSWRSVQDWYLTLKEKNLLESHTWIVPGTQ